MLKMHMTRMHTDMPKTFKFQHEGCGKFFRVSNCYIAIGCLEVFIKALDGVGASDQTLSIHSFYPKILYSTALGVRN